MLRKRENRGVRYRHAHTVCFIHLACMAPVCIYMKGRGKGFFYVAVMQANNDEERKRGTVVWPCNERCKDQYRER